jgi:hypothetical protein
MDCERCKSTRYYRHSLLIAIFTPVPHMQTTGTMYVFHIITKITKASHVKKIMYVFMLQSIVDDLHILNTDSDELTG